MDRSVCCQKHMNARWQLEKPYTKDKSIVFTLSLKNIHPAQKQVAKAKYKRQSSGPESQAARTLRVCVAGFRKCVMHLPYGIFVHLFHNFVMFSYSKLQCPLSHHLIGKGLTQCPLQWPGNPCVMAGQAKVSAATRWGKQARKGGSFSPWRSQDFHPEVSKSPHPLRHWLWVWIFSQRPFP